MLEDAAAKVERWSDAVAFGRRLVQVLPSDSEARAGAERRLGELLAASREAERKSAGTLRIGEAVASESIAIRDLTLD
ncbi:MAG TPA: hypothetical protein PLV92_29300 [Pirellulaceae bacterium]|nr:hypothetical protein [Pirellulaceae bacterium]